MKPKLPPTIDIRRGERFALILATIFAFISISSVVIGRGLSDAILLSARPEIDIAQFFILSSLALMLSSTVYFALVRIIAPTKLTPALIIIFVLTTIYLRTLSQSNHPSHVLAISIFLTIGPALLNILCWNTITDYFDSRQGRRLFHLIFAASTFGGLVAGLAMPPFIHAWGVEALFFAQIAAFTLTIPPAIILSQKQKNDRTAITFSQERKLTLIENLKEGLSDIWQSSLLKTLALVVVFAAIATNVIDFALKDYLRANFSKDEIGLFYGHYNAIANAINLIFQILFVQSFLRRFRLSTPFLIVPLILLFLLVPYFIFASFLSIVALKFFDSFLRFTLQDPAREIALAPIPYFQRNRAKIFIKGFMNPLGAILAGLLLSLTQNFGPRSVLAFVLIPTLIIWIASLRKINKSYRKDLLRALSETAPQESDKKQNLEEVSEFGLADLIDDAPQIRQCILEQIHLGSSDKPKLKHDFFITILDRELMLAASLSIFIASLQKIEPENRRSQKRMDILLEAYDHAIYRSFRILSLNFDEKSIQTSFNALASPQQRTRAQALELIHSTLHQLENYPLLSILIDELSHGERSAKIRKFIPHFCETEALKRIKNEKDPKLNKALRE